MRRNTAILVIMILASFSAGILIWGGCVDTATIINGEAADDDDSILDDDDADLEPPDAPEVDAPRSPTTLDFQTISGIAEPGSTVYIRGGSSDVTDIADPSTGAFCLKIGLLLNSVNQLAITSEDISGNESEPTNITIEQIQNNAALRGKATASSTSYSEPNNIPDAAIDGNYNTRWSNTTQIQWSEARFNPQWFMVELEELTSISKINIWWPQESFATDFELYYSQLEQPTDIPHEYDGEWNTDWSNQWLFLRSQTNDPSEPISVNSYDYTSKPVGARWVLIVFHSSAEKVIFRYKFELIELELLAGELDEEDPGCPAE